MADEIIESQVASADTGQVAETGTADTTSVTDVAATGADAQQAATPPDSGTADGSATAETAEAAPETPEAAKSRRERQREARKAAAPPSAPTPEQIIAEYRRQEEERQKLEAAHRTRVEGNARFLGENTVTVNGETITEYERVRREATKPLDPGLTIDELEAHNAAVNRLNELTERRQMLANEVDPIRQTATQQARGEALQWIGNQFELALAEQGIDVQKALASGRGQPDPMIAILKTVASELVTPLNERIADLVDQHDADQSEIDALRRQLGGHAPQGMRGGMAANGAGKLTLNQLLSQPDFAERAERGDFAGLDLTK